MWVRSLGQEDLLEEGMTTHSGILAWKIPWTEEPGRLQKEGPKNKYFRFLGQMHSLLQLLDYAIIAL